MRKIKNLLPIRFQNNVFFFKHRNKTILFLPNKKLFWVIIGLLGITILYKFLNPQKITHIYNTVYNLPLKPNTNEKPSKMSNKTSFDIQDSDLVLASIKPSYNLSSESFKDLFIIKKQLLVSSYLIKEKVSRIDQLSIPMLLELNGKITRLFIENVLKESDIEPHVLQFFTDTTKINKISTALMEQAKFHIPSSIKLAQAALETAYGHHVNGNNFFGIKDKSRKTPSSFTTEYFTNEQLKKTKAKIISKTKKLVNGKTFYKCKVTDHFAYYSTPWKSFRAHSIHLANNSRYSPLFTKGKDYNAWADKIGSIKHGGVGYATSPIYGQILKTIIKRYHLYLLDY